MTLAEAVFENPTEANKQALGDYMDECLSNRTLIINLPPKHSSIAVAQGQYEFDLANPGTALGIQFVVSPFTETVTASVGDGTVAEVIDCSVDSPNINMWLVSWQ